jgi:UDP-N-acetylmuramoyl-tripeptide--D-alanyl-D-alanine ligase
MTIGEIAETISAVVNGISRDTVINESAVIDSRLANPETFFIALAGERVHGNDFAQSAIAHGARFAITTREVDGPCLIVEDTLIALKQLAHKVRTMAKDCAIIGITGSQGKTTTKELLGHILATAGETVIPQGSFNNEIGLPLTILGCTSTTRYCVLEMGARHVGDISSLMQIAEPVVGTVLVVGSAHIGEFGSREKIAQAKGEMISNLQSGGVAVLGTYDEFTPHMGEDRSDITRITFGESHACDIRAADIEMREGRAHFDLVTHAGRAAVSLRLLGAHQIPNALAAAAISTALNIPLDSIASALSTAEITSKWRMELCDLGEFLIINDSYNANPESVKAALSTLALFAQERGGASWAILGKMHELGESEKDSHLEIGRLAAELGIDHLVAVGTNLYGTGSGEMTVHNCSTHHEALELVRQSSRGDCFLIKASRAEALDVLAEEIIELCKSRMGEE